MTAENSAPASGASSSASITHQHATFTETPQSRRQRLQQQCLEPSSSRSTAYGDHRVEAWLLLLGITEDHIQAHITTLQDEKLPEKEQPSSSTKFTDLASIPLDKDGWQVADQDILREAPVTAGLGRGDDGWKVVKSKKSRRRRDDETASTVSAPNSPELDRSERDSDAVESRDSSPKSNDDAETPIDPSRKVHPHQPATVATRTPPPQYLNLSSRDVEQVAKDVERSFIGPAFKHLFPPQATHSDDGSDDGERTPALKQQRRAQLSHLILTTLSRYPSLHYFQGYHDILSAVLLALTPHSPDPSVREQAILQLAAERLSLHVIRDSMTPDLLPILGQLRLVSNLVHLCDPELAELMDRASPVPFFALPWLLTLLTHDAAEVEVMQRAVEFVLAYGPGAAIYLCAAVLMARREEVMGMDDEQRQDPAVLHAVLGRLPLICAEGVQGGEKTRGRREEANAIYTDPDVELPSLAADRALAASSGSRNTPAAERRGMAISTLLQQTVSLMHRYPLSALQAPAIMGPASVLFTWPALFDRPCASIDWHSATTLAETALAGPTERLVQAPHPPPPPSTADPLPSDDDDEKHPHPHRGRSRRDNALTQPHNARVLAVVGLSGLLVAALFTASQTPAATGRMASASAEHTNRVLTLIVSLLSTWGRVVGGTS
ncbi:hypothetical protein EX895_002706 [Sporisorium graminicola]|uniref:Rab-GAP TBC domain-containing protein n=1 Tax=Sporisorium graminicola TaxID=280036 RepID=A0A4U7KUP0_9BASI|nr:hypothetical protein EX895_002706 [Sporisorium graminicola]TKY88354.1 hypothetical protein EX895_002706 [Sporisorium graminicola]